MNPFDVKEIEMQNYFLMDGSVKEVVTFGVPRVETWEIRAVDEPRHGVLPRVSKGTGILCQLFSVFHAKICNTR